MRLPTNGVFSRLTASLPPLAVLASLALAAPALLGQTVPFTIRVQQPDFVTSVANNSTVGVNTALGSSETLTVTLVYNGIGQARITGAPELIGSTTFELINVTPAPATLTNGQSYSFGVRFTPRRSPLVSAQVSVPFVETVTSNSTPPTVTTTQGTINLQFSGTAPELVTSYIQPDTQNYIPLPNGETVPFPLTAVNSTNTVVISVANRGSGAGELTSVSVSGQDFQGLGIGFLPATLQPGTETRFGVRFQPLSEGTKTGTLTIVTEAGTQTYSLSGTAYTTRFSYEAITPNGAVGVIPGGTINVGEGQPGELLSVQLLVTNVNPVSATLPAISVFGSGFALSEVPSGRVLRPGETVGFFIQAQPTQTGVLRGRLRIGDDAFDLVATATGAQLRYSYTSSGSSSVVVLPNGSVFFRPTQIGLTEDAIFNVRNDGISRASVLSIAVADTTGVFTLADLPALPINLDPGQEFSFRVRFMPNSTGNSTSALRIDGTVFTLFGTAAALPPLPAYVLTQASGAPLSSGNVGPLEQPSVGLTLSAPYPLALTGVLTLGQEAAGFVNDPSVRFANGAQTATFTIPANSTRAIFANGATSVRFQTGSVSGVIFLRATFSVGTTTLPDDNAQIVRLTILAAPPRILSAVANTGTNVIVMTITALAVTRSVTKLDFEIKPVEGATFDRTQFSVNLEGESLGWFRSSASQASGGIFALQIPLNLSSTGNTSTTTGSNLVQAVSSIDVTLTNESGTSNRFTITLR